MMWYFLSFYTLGTAAAELITLLGQNNVTCVVIGDTFNSTVYLEPPVSTGFIKDIIQIENWTKDDWTITSSLNSNQSFLSDKRWEDFRMLDKDTGHALTNNSLSFSVCISRKIYLNIYPENFATEYSLNFTPNNIPKNTEACTWFHYSLLNENQNVSLISEDGKVLIQKLTFKPYWIYLKGETDESTIFWKLHEYEFRMATTITNVEKSSISIPFAENNTCISLYVSIDEDCFLDVELEMENMRNSKTILGFNEANSLKKWKRIEIQADAPGQGKLSFNRGKKEQGSIEGYWAIDEIAFCNKNIESYYFQLNETSPIKHTCKILEDSKDSFEDMDTNIIPCAQTGLLGENCNVGCDTILGESYSYCENYMICQDSSTCFCAWGYQGSFCNRTCDNGTWGLFCKNKCNPECHHCHPSSGECLETGHISSMGKSSIIIHTNLTSKELTEHDLPTNITMTSNKIEIFLSKIVDTDYDMKYICVSKWCANEVIFEEKFPVNKQTQIVRELKEMQPFTHYKAVVSATGQNQVIQRTYHLIKVNAVHKLTNMTVFCSNSSSLWVRFSIPKHTDVHVYKIWYHEINSRIPPQKVGVSQCSIWKNFVCGEINNLKSNSIYSLTVEYNGSKQRKFSEILQGVTTENESEAPENLKVIWSSNNEPILTWNHPWITNGPLKEFFIAVQKENGFINHDTVYVNQPEQLYQYKLPVPYDFEYNISVQGLNSFKGKKGILNVRFLPMGQEFPSTNRIIHTCSEACYFVIPKTKSIKSKSDYTLVQIPTYEINDNMEHYFTSLTKPEKIQRGWRFYENIGYDEHYIALKIDKGLKLSPSFINNNDFRRYSKHLVLWTNSGDFWLYSIGTPNEEVQKANESPSLSTLTLIITICAFLLFLFLLLMLLLRLYWKIYNNNNMYRGISSVEESLHQENTYDHFTTKVENRFLENYLKHALLNSKDLISQFRSLARATNRPTLHAFHQNNKNKNKDAHNVPYDHNRIFLKNMEGLGTEDYINASYIDGLDRPKTYIATQGPKFYTVRDFWRMIWQEHVQIIVMATNFMENKQRKCAEYFPQDINSTFECGEMLVKLNKQENYEYYIARFFEVYYKKCTRMIQHFHLKWNPDNLRPMYPNNVVPLVKKISLLRESSDKPIVVHCSSGTNRTGTLILCDLALQMANTKNCVDFYTLLKNMREQRPNMISSEKQYILAHLIILECFMEEENIFKKSINENFDTAVLKSQLRYLRRLSWHDQVVQSWSPYKSHLSDYSLYSVDGYAKHKKFLTTQLPTKNTLVSFWDMIVREKIHIILVLSSQKHKICAYQWQTSKYQTCIKELDSVSTEYYKLTQLVLLVSQLPKNNITLKQKVSVIQLKKVGQSSNTQSSNAFLGILNDINENHPSENPVLVTCHDGVTTSGLFVALDYIIEKCKNEFEVDLCNGLVTVRRNGILYVNTPAQMEFLYKAVLEFLQKFDEYSSIL